MSVQRGAYTWVDEGLARLGLTLDLRDDERPPDADAGPLTVDSLMRSTFALLAAPERLVVQQAAKGAGWTAEVGRVAGTPMLVERTVLPGPTAFDRAAFARFSIDDAMTELARAWDETFRAGAFTHIVLRTGEAFEAGARSLAGEPFAGVAKVMRWTYRVPTMTDRELVTLYVPHQDADSMTAVYLPVRGAKPLPMPRTVRSRVLVPCLDRAIFDGERVCEFIHYASADLGGAFPGFVARSAFFRSVFLSTARAEAGHLRAVLDGTGVVGQIAATTPSRDGLVVDPGVSRT